MPSQRPCAAFEPISPDLDVPALVEATPNFEFVVRIHRDMIEHQGIENFEKLILLHVIIGGKPLVIEGYQNHLERWTFALQWLKDNCSQKVENARDLTKQNNLPLSVGHYLNNMPLLANQWNSKNYKDPERQRIYLKDIDCPALWHEKLKRHIPPVLYYLNESTGEPEGPGGVAESKSTGAGSKKGRGIAQAGDLMSSLPPEMRAENMMCYIGHEGTYTPAHREMCASLGQNIMVEASTGAMEDGKETKPGSSIWFMTETKDRHVVSEYWLSALGHDIEVEKHFAQVNAWRAAPFTTYVVEQRVGDFILIPPLAPHQVWNRGTRTMKAAWNRTTVETLEWALNEALPRTRMVCRDEQYKNKAIVYYTLIKYSKLLAAAAGLHTRSGKPPSKIRQLQKDFRRLFTLFNNILISESFPAGQEERKVQFVAYDSNITCAYCRGNIYNRFITCPGCIGELPNGEEDTYDICMECYAMGRSCRCISKLKWVEQFNWGELTQKHEQWRLQIVAFEGKVSDKAPVSLKAELEKHEKRTLAEICQMELKRRPWKDPSKPDTSLDQGDVSEEVEVKGDVIVARKRKARKSEKFKRENKNCHFHGCWEPRWKQVECSQCDLSFCYGVLARAFDMKPQEILADKAWRCPKCRHFCICRRCRKKPEWKMVEPPRTMLGHGTKAVADPRSVESLVDYSQSNISWLQKVGDDGRQDTRRLQKRQKAAQKEKAQQPQLDDYHMTGQDDQQVEGNILLLAQQEGIPIDSSLVRPSAPARESGDEEDIYNENPQEAALSDFDESYSQGPSRPQNIIPSGGILRDPAHAYDDTEAVTFDYPDPDFDLTSLVAEPKNPTAQPPPGYEAAEMQTQTSEIEMTQRKRKRSGVEPNDLPSKARRKSVAANTQRKKPRKSLVVKLSIDKNRLSNLSQMALIAQRALMGIDFDNETPVVGSDLRALNASSGAVGGVPSRQRKPNLDPAEEQEDDDDDEFTGPRKRKDRPPVNPDPESAPARRTRTQNVAHDEHVSLDTFEDTENSNDAATSYGPSPRDQHNSRSQSEEARDGAFTTNNQETSASSSSAGDSLSIDQQSTKPNGTIKSFAAINQTGLKITLKQTAKETLPVSSQKDLTEPAKTVAKRTSMETPIQPQPKPQMSEAEKNRKAKLAAINGLDGGVDDDFESDGWLESEEEEEEEEDDFVEDVTKDAVTWATTADWGSSDDDDNVADDIPSKISSRKMSKANGSQRTKATLEPAVMAKGSGGQKDWGRS